MLSYIDFVFIKDTQGKYTLVDCSKKPQKLWLKPNTWNVKDKNDKIVVFVYQGKIMGDTGFFALAFTTEKNFKNRHTELFDFEKICRLGTDYSSFLEIQEYLVETFGYKKENIFEEENDKSREYKELGIFNI